MTWVDELGTKIASRAEGAKEQLKQLLMTAR